MLIDVEDQVDPLPLFQHTLRRLWDVAQGEPRHLREDDYVTVRGLVGSINHRANEVAATLTAENSQDGVTLERVMKALTTLDEHDRITRRPQKRSELLTLLADGSQGGSVSASVDRLLEAFGAEATSFLRVGEGDDPEIDIGHEALIRGWTRLAGEQRDFATGWVREEREDGEEWRGLVRRAEAGGRLNISEQRRIARWIKQERLGPAWSQRYGNAWDLMAAMRRRSARFTVMTGAVLCIVVPSGRDRRVDVRGANERSG